MSVTLLVSALNMIRQRVSEFLINNNGLVLLIMRSLSLLAFLPLMLGCMHDPQSTESRVRDIELPIAGSQLIALLADEQGRYVFAADAQHNAIHFVGADDFSVQATVNVSGPPIAMDTSADGRLLAGISDDPPGFSMIDIGSRTVIGSAQMSGSIPTSVAFDAFNRLYVGVNNDDDTRAVRIFEIAGPQPWPELARLQTGDGYIAGRSGDRLVLYTSDEGRGSADGVTPLIRQWNLNLTPPAVINSAQLFGTTSTGNGWLFSMPAQDDRVLIYGRGVQGEDGSVFDDGMLPVFDTASLERVGTLDVVGCQPVAAAATADGARIIVGHGVNTVNAMRDCDSHFNDIHIFDAETFEQIDAIRVSDFVRPDGLIVGPDRVVYALLGNPTTTRIGIYVR